MQAIELLAGSVCVIAIDEPSPQAPLEALLRLDENSALIIVVGPVDALDILVQFALDVGDTESHLLLFVLHIVRPGKLFTNFLLQNSILSGGLLPKPLNLVASVRGLGYGYSVQRIVALDVFLEDTRNLHGLSKLCSLG